MRYNPTRLARRKGAMAPFVGVLLIALLLMVAFTIDLGYLVQGREELQNAADMSALSAPMLLLDRDELTGNPAQADEITAAHTAAVAYALKNTAGGVNLVVNPNDANDPGGDVVIGYLPNPTDRTTTFQYNSGTPPTSLSPPMLFSSPSMPSLGLFWLPTVVNPPIPFITPPATMTTPYNSYNSVQVTVSRNAQENGSLPLFFGNLTGTGTVNLQATATATLEDNIKGFHIVRNGPPTSTLLPFAMDVNTFAAIASGNSVLDLYKYNPTGPATAPVYPGPPATPPNYAGRVSLDSPNVAAVLSDPRLNPTSTQFSPNATTLVNDLLPGDNIKEALLVPLAVPAQTVPIVGTVSIGNFGTLYIGNSTKNSYSEFKRQVLYGPNAQDFADMGGSLQLGSDGTLAMTGDGLIAMTMKELFTSVKGQPRVIALYRPTSSTLQLSTLANQIVGDRSYTIVGFGGVVILDVLDIPGTPAVTNPLTGQVLVPGGTASVKLLIQPEFVIDATAIGGGSLLNNGGTKTSRFVYRPLALVR